MGAPAPARGRGSRLGRSGTWRARVSPTRRRSAAPSPSRSTARSGRWQCSLSTVPGAERVPVARRLTPGSVPFGTWRVSLGDLGAAQDWRPRLAALAAHGPRDWADAAFIRLRARPAATRRRRSRVAPADPFLRARTRSTAEPAPVPGPFARRRRRAPAFPSGDHRLACARPRFRARRSGGAAGTRAGRRARGARRNRGCPRRALPLDPQDCRGGFALGA